jgi:hypothetical protein
VIRDRFFSFLISYFFLSLWHHRSFVLFGVAMLEESVSSSPIMFACLFDLKSKTNAMRPMREALHTNTV